MSGEYDDLMVWAESQGFETGKPESLLPEIVITNRQVRDLSEEIQNLLAAANDPPILFVRGGELSRVRRDEERRPLIEAISEHMLSHRAARIADYIKLVGPDKERTSTAPPMGIIRDIMAQGEWAFSALVGIVETPILRPDGSILDTPGYDPATRLFYQPEEGLEIPPILDTPTPGELAQAVDAVDDILVDFPFTDQASRANAWAMLLTAPARHYINDSVPIGLLDAPKMGTGKSLLAEVMAIVATGRPASMFSMPKDDDELRKQLTSALLAGSTTIIIDNLTGPLSAPSLSRFVTCRVWGDRLLGKNTVLNLSNNAMIIATGNNIALGGDLARRCYPTRLDRQMARPWEHTGYRHPQLKNYVVQNRGNLIWAVLTICRSWIQAGAQPGENPILGGFERFCTIMGGILQHCGIDGFLDNLVQMYETMDADTPAWAAFFEVWSTILGPKPISVATLVEKLKANEDFIEVIPEPLATEFAELELNHKNSFRLRMGKALGRRLDTVFPPDLQLKRSTELAHGKVVQWRVLRGISGGMVEAQRGNSDTNWGNEGGCGHEAARVKFQYICSYKSYIGEEAHQSPHSPS